jgi:hypothetical protein
MKNGLKTLLTQFNRLFFIPSSRNRLSRRTYKDRYYWPDDTGSKYILVQIDRKIQKATARTFLQSP